MVQVAQLSGNYLAFWMFEIGQSVQKLEDFNHYIINPCGRGQFWILHSKEPENSDLWNHFIFLKIEISHAWPPELAHSAMGLNLLINCLINLAIFVFDLSHLWSF